MKKKTPLKCSHAVLAAKEQVTMYHREITVINKVLVVLYLKFSVKLTPFFRKLRIQSTFARSASTAKNVPIITNRKSTALFP